MSQSAWSALLMRNSLTSLRCVWQAVLRFVLVSNENVLVCTNATLLEVRSEAIRWEQEGMPGGVRARSQSVLLSCGIQYGVQGGQRSDTGGSLPSELGELREMLKVQQNQLNQLTQSFAQFQDERFAKSFSTLWASDL